MKKTRSNKLPDVKGMDSLNRYITLRLGALVYAILVIILKLSILKTPVNYFILIISSLIFLTGLQIIYENKIVIYSKNYNGKNVKSIGWVLILISILLIFL
ncbi:MAG: hypothetical protein AABX23_00260 [Nanoarchaeota archaeon]